MAAQSNQLSASKNSKYIFGTVEGSLISVISNNGYLSGNSIRDRNINLFFQGGYEAKLLVNSVQSYIVMVAGITNDSDPQTIDNAVQNSWSTIFDVELA
jgi:hypothetical protein